MSKKVKIQIAREFRKNPTNSERILWQALRRNNFLGLGFRRQHVIEGYIVDFYCHKIKFVVEVDGPIHNFQIREDRERRRIIEGKGINFYRVNSKDVEDNLDEALKEIKYYIEKNFEV